MTHPYPTSICEAALLLDRVKPGWENRIDKNRINMSGGSFCILGQLYGGYYNGTIELFGFKYGSSGGKTGDSIFGTQTDEKYWIKEIDKRLALKQDFTWAVEQLKEDKKVRRKSWLNKGFYLYNISGNVHGFKNDRFTFFIEDFSSTDWEIYTPEMLVRQGSRIKMGSNEYIVAKFDINKMCLINLVDGNRWAAPIERKCSDIIPIKEFFQEYKNYEKIELIKY